MKKYIALLLIVFIYTICAQESDFYNSDCSKSIEQIVQILLKRWHTGADGNGQGGTVDSVVLGLVKDYISWAETIDEVRDFLKNSHGRLKSLEDLQRYRGLGIFLKTMDTTPVTTEVLKRYYNTDIKYLKSYDTKNTGVDDVYKGLIHNYRLVMVKELPDGEQVYYLISEITKEVLSTYKEKIK